MDTFTCVNCQRSTPKSKVVLTLPWEDGDNSHAYVTCPHCGYETIMYGYGEDDVF